LQALEYPSLSTPGTVAHLTLKPGSGLEAPGRVTLGHWRNERVHQVNNRWLPIFEVPLEDIRGDSCVAMYWPEKELAAGVTRQIGFAYGLGSLSSGEGGGKLALTKGGSFVAGDEFTVTALVSEPATGETVTLTLPSGLELVGGTASQPVPPLPEGGTSKNSPVTWRVKSTRAGHYTLKAESSRGAKQSEPVTIRKSRVIFD
jgi:hypothetical protein